MTPPLLIAALLFASSPAMPSSEGVDIFLGTLERQGDAVILRRCDLVENRYALVDAPGAHALDKLRKAKLPAYGEVIGRYMEQDGRSILQVERIEKLTPGKNCHLADALGG